MQHNKIVYYEKLIVYNLRIETMQDANFLNR